VTLASELATILGVFALAFVVRLLVADPTDVSYSVVLVLAGLGVSALGGRRSRYHRLRGRGSVERGDRRRGSALLLARHRLRGCTPWFRSRSC
jgi:hypothetical protein